MTETLKNEYKTVVISSRTFGGFRVWCYNVLNEHQYELYFEDIFTARSFAKEWLKNEVF